MAKKIPSLYGLALTNLMEAHGWTAKALAAAAGVAQSTISAYTTGDNGLTREGLEELAKVMGLEAEDVEQAVLGASLVLPPPTAAWSPVDPTPQERRVIDRAAAFAARETAEQVREDLLRELRAEKRETALAEGRRLASVLKTYSDADRRTLVDKAPDYQHWGLAVALCLDSEKAAAHDPREALKLAELAVLVAQHVPGTDAWRSRLEGWCTGFLANAQRGGLSLPHSEATFARVWPLWKAGEDEACLLSEAYLLDLEASLRRDQRLFSEALKRHEEALALAGSEERGVVLLNKAFTLQEKGDHELALQTLEQAAQVIDGERQPRLRCVLRFNQASCLTRLGRAAEAEPIAHEVRELAERLRNAVDLVKALWLHGIVAAGLGRRQEALEALEQVRRDFEALTLPYDYALASLDLALVYREEERSADIKRVAAEIVTIFEAQRVQREAIAAVLLFRDAAEKEQVTAGLVRQLQDYLVKSKRNPELRFVP